jgi:hypothetical protein
VDDSVDVFDGYSFKGRHSILLNSDDDDEDGEDGEVDGDEASLIEETQLDQEPVVNGLLSPEDNTPEPKTPEASRVSLPEHPVDIAPTTDLLVEALTATPRTSQDGPAPESPLIETILQSVTDPKRKLKPRPTTAHPSKSSRMRREKSGVPALDRDLSDTIDEDGEVTEKDEEDDDWDFIEAVDGEDRNGAQGASLFARGVVDRYRLAVFRKASTPVPTSSRSFSGTSKASNHDGLEPADSPSPSNKQRRGRTPGLTFRKHPRQFLRAKSPHSKKSSASKSLTHSTSATLSVSTSSSPGLLTPSPSLNSALPATPSLKSKESAVSVGTQSGSSDQSPTGGDSTGAGAGASDTIKGPPPPPLTEEPEKLKTKKLKKYKEGAEKVLSLFASPRQS